MNKNRRIIIKSIIDKLNDLQPCIEQVRDDEQEFFDNMPEGLQEGVRGEAAQEAIDELDNALAQIEDAIVSLEGSIKGQNEKV